MNLAGFDLNLLVVFEALYQERGVTAAARRLGLGQPAASAALGRLRALLGDPVFERVGGRMMPTPRAHEMAPRLIASLNDLRRTLGEHSAFQPDADKRSFAIASTDYTSLALLPGLLENLRREAPHVELRVQGYDKDQVGELLDRNEVELALGVFSAPPERAVATPLYTERFVGVARIGHPAVTGGFITKAAFAAASHALVTVRRDARGVIDEALERDGLTRRIVLTLPHMMVLPEVLARTDLISAVPERLAPRFGPGLQTFRLPLVTAPWRVIMLWNPNRRTDRSAVWLRSLVRAAASARDGESRTPDEA